MNRKDDIEYPDRLSLSGTGHHHSQYQTQKNFVGKGPKGYRRQDATIYEEVCEALKQDPYVDASDIEAEVNEGVITLRGTVRSREMKRLAEECIEDLHGVEDVYNLLKFSGYDEEGTRALIKNQSEIE